MAVKWEMMLYLSSVQQVLMGNVTYTNTRKKKTDDGGWRKEKKSGEVPSFTSDNYKLRTDVVCL